ncbi:MAG: NAD(P)H-hydrate dehydratase [Candidatus Magasanikiibacteriota bacterium]
MDMQEVNQEIINRLNKPKKDSHKGQNGRVLIIAGSEKYHGALLMTLQTASRIVDMVYVYSPTNQKLIEKLKSEIAVFINVFDNELWNTVDLVDCVLIGPGLEENKETKKITEKLLKKYPEKPVIVDATALWHVDPLLLHHNCIVTPHSREFENVFQCAPMADNVLKMAKYYQCNIILKGTSDYISDGQDIWENKTGNVGMTKGGTGDVLAGTVAGLSAKNDLLTSALAGAYLTGLAGDKLYKTKGTFYNAEDVIGSLGFIWNEYVK